ncbi:MAG: HAD family phosphatase [Clostridia bacterium]|nr:HAD family phosphatase [Clostridia bacterium]
MKYKGIIFDMDGVLIETEHLHYKAYQKALKNYGFDLTQSLYNEKIRSRGRSIGLRDLISEIPDEAIKSIGKEKDTFFSQLVDEGTDLLYEDAQVLIRYLKEAHFKLGLATASHNGTTMLKKYNLFELFDVVVTAKDVKNNKPNPEIYNLCKSHLGLEDHELLVIEDSNAGIQAALDAQLKVIYIKREDAPPLHSQFSKHPKVLTYVNLEKVISDLNKRII